MTKSYDGILWFYYNDEWIIQIKSYMLSVMYKISNVDMILK